MIVLDTSAALQCLVGSAPDDRLIESVQTSGTIHVPHLIDVEVLSALRGLVHGRQLSEGRARDAWFDFDRLRMLRYPLSGLAARVWELRDRMTAYDATFVALAQRLVCPLVTCDRKLARAAEADTEVELFAVR